LDFLYGEWGDLKSVIQQLITQFPVFQQPPPTTHPFLTDQVVQDLLDSGLRRNIDPRLLVAIAAHETVLTQNMCGSNTNTTFFNAWNLFWGCGGSSDYPAKCWENCTCSNSSTQAQCVDIGQTIPILRCDTQFNFSRSCMTDDDCEMCNTVSGLCSNALVPKTCQVDSDCAACKCRRCPDSTFRAWAAQWKPGEEPTGDTVAYKLSWRIEQKGLKTLNALASGGGDSRLAYCPISDDASCAVWPDRVKQYLEVMGGDASNLTFACSSVTPAPTGTIEVKRVDGTGATLPSTIPTTAAIDTGVEKSDNPAFFAGLLVSGNPYTVGATDRPEYLETVATCSAPGCTLLPGEVTYIPADCDGIFCSIDVNVLDGGLTRVVFLYDQCAPGYEKSGTACVPIGPHNNPPTITSLTANPMSVQVDEQSTISVVASDPDGDALTYAWEATCGTLSATTGAGDKTWTAPSTAGTCTVSVTVTDPAGASATQGVDIEVTSAPSNTFAINDRVQVAAGAGASLNVRSTPNGSVVGQQPDSSLGTIIGGPVFADGFWWWQVDFDTGVDGWVVQDFLGVPPLPPMPLAYAQFAVFNRTPPKMLTGFATGATVAVFNRTLLPTGTTGGRVTVHTGDGSNLNVRSAPGLSGAILGVQADGSLGTVIGGPISANGFQWWSVNFDSGADGWVAGEFLEPPPGQAQSVATTLAVFNTAAPDAIDGHVEGPVFSVDNVP
jgi:hypothetical protein